MIDALKIFGARANVYLNYDGALSNLAKHFSEKLPLPEFYFDTDEDEPHDEFASCETLGFYVWLGKSDVTEFDFLIRIETEHNFDEMFNDQMHDLSPWLARFIAEICDVESRIIEPRTQNQIKFTRRSDEAS